MHAIRSAPEVCSIFCATANPVEIVIAQSEQGRGVLGVIDGSSPKGEKRRRISRGGTIFSVRSATSGKEVATCFLNVSGLHSPHRRNHEECLLAAGSRRLINAVCVSLCAIKQLGYSPAFSTTCFTGFDLLAAKFASPP